jgi:uncharacterized damage-inducible protein DinB
VIGPDAVVFPEPTDPRATRADVFLGYLDYFRERVIDKLHRLPSEEAGRSRLPSGWSPAELAVHLRHVERRWLEWGFLGLEVDDPWADEVDGRWRVPPDMDVSEVCEQLRRQGARSRSIILAHRLDEVAKPGPRWRGAEPATLERVLFHLVQEYARHLGQLDVVVELVTGTTGE